MPVSGAKPKPPGQAVTRNKPVHEWTEVEDIPFLDGPKLPRTRPDGRPWLKRTREKWAAWSQMPHARLWGPAEWDFALDSIELAALVHEGAARLATELRNRERVLGTTWDFRRDLRIRYVQPKADENLGDVDAGVTNIADYRAL